MGAHSLSRRGVGLGFIPGFVLLRKMPPIRRPKLLLQLLDRVKYFQFLNFQSQISDFQRKKKKCVPLLLVTTELADGLKRINLTVLAKKMCPQYCPVLSP